MPTPDAPNVVMVPVKRFDINITLPEILTPLTQMTAKVARGFPASPADAELHGHIKELSDLAAKLNEVAGLIHDIDPSLLAPGSTPPPKE